MKNSQQLWMITRNILCFSVISSTSTMNFLRNMCTAQRYLWHNLSTYLGRELRTLLMISLPVPGRWGWLCGSCSSWETSRTDTTLTDRCWHMLWRNSSSNYQNPSSNSPWLSAGKTCMPAHSLRQNIHKMHRLALTMFYILIPQKMHLRHY